MAAVDLFWAWGLQTSARVQVFQKHAHGRAFQSHPGLGTLRPAGHEFGHAAAVEIVCRNQVLLCPLRELSRDGQLPLQCFIGIAKGTKLLDERFDLAVKQFLLEQG